MALDTLTDDDRVRAVYVRGVSAKAQISSSIMSGDISLSTDGASQLTLTIDDPDLSMVSRGLFDQGADVDFADLGFDVTGYSIAPSESSTVTVTCRSRGWRRLKARKGKHTWRGVSPSQVASAEARAAGLVAVVQPSPKRATIVRAGGVDDNSWSLITSLADELGYWAFEAAGVLYFGKPTWLAARVGERTWPIRWSSVSGKRTPGLASISDGSRSEDSPSAASVTFQFDAVDAYLIRPGHIIALSGLPRLSGRLIVTDVTIPIDAAGLIEVVAVSPKNPTPNPPDSGGDGSDSGSSSSSSGGGGSSGGGQKIRLRTLLQQAGFSGNGLEIAIGVVYAESNYNAKAVGDVHLENSKWGPSVGLFQIRSLKHPTRYSGNDRDRVESRLSDAVYNAKLAYRLSNRGTSWHAWSTYNSGSYRKNYRKGRNPYVKNYVTPGSSSSSGGSGSGSSGGGTGKRASSPVVGHSRVTFRFGVKGPYAAGYHTGEDRACPTGSRAVAVLDGKIVKTGWQGDYGNVVVLRTGSRDRWYCHLSKIKVKVGQRVKAGQLVGYTGSTGNSTGPHLHFEDRPAGGGYGHVRKPSW